MLFTYHNPVFRFVGSNVNLTSHSGKIIIMIVNGSHSEYTIEYNISNNHNTKSI